MDTKAYWILFLFIWSMTFSHGIRFSAESFAEISLLAKKGKTHLESLREKANIPQFGSCWKNAISDLQVGCKFLSENVQSDLALSFTDCFLQMSGHEPLTCDLPKSACLKKLSDRAFNAYTEFYTHTQSICYFLQSQIWHEETEKTIDKLSLTSLQVSQKLEEAGEIQEKLLNQQKESLSLQHDLRNSSKDIASILQFSQEKINIVMKDFQTTAAEQKELLVGVFDNLLLFRAWAVNELSWFNSTLYFVAATIITFLFTSVSRTREARMIIFIIFAFNYLFERLLTSSSLSDPFLGGYLTLTPETLNSYIWFCRKFCVCLGVIVLLYTAISFCDYNMHNYQLLLEIKNQNLKILNHLAVQAKNACNNQKNNFNESNKSFNHSYITSENWSSDVLNKHYENVQSRLHKSSKDGLSSNSPVVWSSNFFSKDVLDCEEKNPVDTVSVMSEKDSSKESEQRYNLRSYKSRKSSTVHNVNLSKV